MLADYLIARELSVADACDWSGGITSPGMHRNDQMGCCVVAGGVNAVQSTTKCSGGIERSVPDDYVETAYELLGGYVPGNEATDNGLVGVDFLNWWRTNTLNGSILDAYADPILIGNDADEFKLSVQEFGGVFTGVQLRQTDMDAFLAGKPWDAGGSDGSVVGGHWLWCCGFNAQGPVFQTWDKNQQAAWMWLISRQDELHTPLMPDWMNKDGESPAGIDVASLHHDLELVTA